MNYLTMFFARLRKPGYYTTYDEVQLYFGVLVTCFALAFFVSLTVEAPMLNLEKLMFSSFRKGELMVADIADYLTS